MDMLYVIIISLIMAELLHVQTYNMKGFNNSREYVRNIIDKDKPDIICLQETWHLKEMHQQFSNIHKEYTYVEESGVDSNTTILSGRLYGGLAILYKKCIAGSVTKIDFLNNRLLGIHIKGIHGCKDIVLLTVYMPCDNRRAEIVNDVFIEVLSHIEQIFSQFDDAGFIICGDWNTDPVRHNAQTNAFLEFLTRNNLKLSWNSPNASIGNTYIDHIQGNASCLDHFVMTEAVFASMTKCEIHECPTNTSDHHNVSVICEWDINSNNVSERSHSNKRTAWHRVNRVHIDKYKSNINASL